MSGKSLKESNSRSLMVNVDKGLAFNIFSIKDDDRQTEIIIRSLLLYISFNLIENTYGEDLFGFRTLDPKDFAQKMKISETALREIHPNPLWRVNNFVDVDDKEEFSNYIGNALYILANTLFTKTYRYFDEKERKVVEVESFQFFGELPLN